MCSEPQNATESLCVMSSHCVMNPPPHPWLRMVRPHRCTDRANQLSNRAWPGAKPRRQSGSAGQWANRSVRTPMRCSPSSSPSRPTLTWYSTARFPLTPPGDPACPLDRPPPPPTSFLPTPSPTFFFGCVVDRIGMSGGSPTWMDTAVQLTCRPGSVAGRGAFEA